jgi:hypothetical protein
MIRVFDKGEKIEKDPFVKNFHKLYKLDKLNINKNTINKIFNDIPEEIAEHILKLPDKFGNGYEDYFTKNKITDIVSDRLGDHKQYYFNIYFDYMLDLLYKEEMDISYALEYVKSLHINGMMFDINNVSSLNYNIQDKDAVKIFDLMYSYGIKIPPDKYLNWNRFGRSHYPLYGMSYIYEELRRGVFEHEWNGVDIYKTLLIFDQYIKIGCVPQYVDVSCSYYDSMTMISGMAEMVKPGIYTEKQIRNAKVHTYIQTIKDVKVISGNSYPHGDAKCIFKSRKCSLAVLYLIFYIIDEYRRLKYNVSIEELVVDNVEIKLSKPLSEYQNLEPYLGLPNIRNS